MDTPETTRSTASRSWFDRSRVQFAGLLAGPLLAWLAYSLLPTSYLGSAGEALPFSEAGRATLAVMVWMATWWMTEAIDLTATALLPLVVFPLFGIASMTVASASYAHPLVFLFMGGFLLALSMRRWGLDRRLALITLRMVGSKPTNMVGGFMLVSAVLSAFVSNTATVAMMLPIGMSVVALASKGRATEGCEPTEDPGRSFATCLMLGIAYASSIGGLATIIGTPPNVFLVGFLRNSISEPFRTEVGFAQWMLIGVPLAVVFLPITWWLLTRVLFPVRMPTLKGSREWIEAEYTALGPPNRGEKWTLIVFSLTALAWVLRPLLVGVEWSMDGHLVRPLAGLTDPGIAMTGALTLFVLPVSRRPLEFVMHWGAARELPWGILMLFGGGLSLAAAIEQNGVAEFLGSQAHYIAGMPDILLVLLVCAGVVFLTELASNTATAATLIPVLAALAPGLGVHPFLLVFPATIAASCAFMLPVATPPNAIVFASGEVTIPQMMRAGLWLNAIAVLLITLLTFFVIAPLMGIG